ncbi:MAG: YgfZ/GcvT domain-containing protein [Pseudomonadales bacterium]
MSASSITLDNGWQTCLASLPAHHFDDGQSYFDSEPSFTDLKNTPSIHPLHQLGLIRIQGPDAGRFLQGQLTANAETLGHGESTLAAHCDPKGRMHSNFYLHRIAADHYLLQMPFPMVSIALAALNKYAVFSKATLTDLSSEYAAFGFANTDKDHSHPDALASLTINTVGSIQWIKKARCNDYLKNIQTAELQWCGSAAWEYRLITAGVAFVQPQTVGEFIPQMFNLDYLDGISFTKGCYTGQEIIARMKYRGKVKRRCYPFVISSTSNTIITGDELFDSRDRLTGTIVNVVSDTKNSEKKHGLAVIKVSDTEPSQLSLKDKTFVSITALPYELDSDTE